MATSGPGVDSEGAGMRPHRHIFDALSDSWACTECGAPPEPVAIYDVIHPYAGPCPACGGPDRRHRVADVIRENVRIGHSPSWVAGMYGISVDGAEALVAAIEEETP